MPMKPLKFHLERTDRSDMYREGQGARKSERGNVNFRLTVDKVKKDHKSQNRKYNNDMILKRVTQVTTHVGEKKQQATLQQPCFLLALHSNSSVCTWSSHLLSQPLRLTGGIDPLMSPGREVCEESVCPLCVNGLSSCVCVRVCFCQLCTSVYEKCRLHRNRISWFDGLRCCSTFAVNSSCGHCWVVS